jgi:competence protein ComEC
VVDTRCFGIGAALAMSWCMHTRDPHLWFALALAAGAPWILFPWPVMLVGGVLWIAAMAHGSRRAPFALVALMALTAIRARVALNEARQEHEAVDAALHEPTRCALIGTVVASPVVLRRSVAGERPEHHDARIDLEVASASCDEERRLPVGTVVRLYGADERWRRGDRVEVVATIGPTRLFDNPASLDPYVGIALRGTQASGGMVTGTRLGRGAGIAWWIDGARAHVRARIEASYPPPIAPYARALVLGETDLTDADRQAFRQSGLAHLLAVSGTHLIIAVLALSRLLRALLARVPALAARIEVGRIAALAAAVFAWVYADFAGGGGSAYRAAAMMSAAMLVRALGRRPSGRRAFAWSLVGGVVLQPLAVFDLSFALSVAATGGLLVAAKPLAAATRTRGRLVAAVTLSAGATVAATLACAPILLSVGPALPILGVAANLIAAPIGELVALPVSLLHTVLWWAPSAERGAALVAGGALALVRALAQGTVTSPWAGVALPPPTAWQLAVLAAGLGARMLWPEALRRRRLGAALVMVVAFGAFEVVARFAGAPTGRLRVTVLDVAQGDAILVDLPDGKLMVVDGGGLVGSPIDTGRRVLLPELRRRRRDRVDVVVLSHPHPDHYGGLWALFDAVEVGELWTSDIAAAERPDGQVARRLEALGERGIAVRSAKELCGAHPLGGLVVDVLAPCPSFSLAQNVNDNSLVLRLAFGRRAVMLTGDAERATETTLVEGAKELRADLLKVGHHGSRTSSTPRFVRAVAPSLAVASCGVRNRFNHPHPLTQATFAAFGVPLLRTDRGGALVWETDGEELRWQRTRGPVLGEL